MKLCFVLCAGALSLLLPASAAHARAATEDSMQIHSTAFSDKGEIPQRYTCDGQDVSPPLAWSGVPRGTQSLVLIVDDPDAPDPAAPKRTWVHWVLYNLPDDARSLPEAVPSDADLTGGGQHGENSWRRLGYGGPCPPSGTHRYFFKLYALDTVLDLSAGADKKQVLQAMEGHVLAEAELMGTYSRQ